MLTLSWRTCSKRGVSRCGRQGPREFVGTENTKGRAPVLVDGDGVETWRKDAGLKMQNIRNCKTAIGDGKLMLSQKVRGIPTPTILPLLPLIKPTLFQPCCRATRLQHQNPTESQLITRHPRSCNCRQRDPDKAYQRRCRYEELDPF
jgi:hypothetical protein